MAAQGFAQDGEDGVFFEHLGKRFFFEKKKAPRLGQKTFGPAGCGTSPVTAHI
jgi:hypothetical protein